VLAVVLTTDRITKELACVRLSGDAFHAIRVIRRFLYLRLTRNPAGLLGFLEGLAPTLVTVFFVLTTLAFCGIVVHFIRKASDAIPHEAEALALILAGFLGNGLDRVIHGAVIDCLQVNFGTTQRITLNIADLAILLGLLWTFALHFRARQRTAPSGELSAGREPR